MTTKDRVIAGLGLTLAAGVVTVAVALIWGAPAILAKIGGTAIVLAFAGIVVLVGPDV